MLQAGIKTQLTLYQSDIWLRVIINLSVSKGIFLYINICIYIYIYIYIYFTHTLPATRQLNSWYSKNKLCIYIYIVKTIFIFYIYIYIYIYMLLCIFLDCTFYLSIIYLYQTSRTGASPPNAILCHMQNTSFGGVLPFDRGWTWHILSLASRAIKLLNHIAIQIIGFMNYQLKL